MRHVTKLRETFPAYAGQRDHQSLGHPQTAHFSIPSHGGLKLYPFWDPLRGDPRFEKFLEESKKPVALK
ncbi:MAG TPA: hypothetical protein VNE84_08910 [Candidatus Limnocylindria bacterium]|nr:hypothetical protein [Candidatus Limnocylindria bacterium]